MPSIKEMPTSLVTRTRTTLASLFERARIEVELMLRDPAGSAFPTPETCDEEPGSERPDKQMTGQQVGQYLITELITSGGMGTIYLAVQENPRRMVALKMVRAELLDASMAERFAFEAHVLGRLRHSGIVQVYEAGVHEEVPFIAMEYVPAALTLSAYIRQTKPELRERIELLSKICDAAGHCHQRGVIHRDLKPSNILVDSYGQPKLIDFGLAKSADYDTPRCEFVGTRHFMSPEQARGQSLDLEASSDVYSLGIVSDELLRDAVPVLDPGLEAVIRKAMDEDPRKRYRTAADFGDDLRRHLDGERVVALPATAVKDRFRVLGRWRGKRPARRR